MKKSLIKALSVALIIVSMCGCGRVDTTSTNVSNVSAVISDNGQATTDKELEGYKWYEDKNGHLWLREMPNTEELTVITNVKGKPVYGIDTKNSSFKKVKKLIIPSGIQEIAECAFYNNTKVLETVIIKEGLTTIGADAFANCTKLKNVELADSIKTIGAEAFFNTSIETLELPSNLEELGDSALLSNCLTNLSIENGVKYEVKDGWIMSKDGTELLLRTVGAFTDNKLKGEFRIPDGVTKLGSCAFANETELTSVIVPSSIKYVGGKAFMGCTGIKELKLPEKMDYIGPMAFADMESLKEFIFPAVSTIAGSVMYKCASLEKLEFVNNTEPVTFEMMAFGECPLKGTIKLPDGTVGISSGCFNLKQATLEVPSTIKYINDLAVELKDDAVIKYKGKEYGSDEYYNFRKEVLVNSRQTPANGDKAALNLDVNLFDIEIDGVKYKVGDPISKLLDNGWSFANEQMEDNTLEPDYYNSNIKMVKKGVKNKTGDDENIIIEVLNLSNSDKKIEDCTFTGCLINSFEINSGSVDGIALGTKAQAQIREMFGYPDERYSDIETEIKEKLTQECTYTFKNKEGIWFNFGSGGTAADSYLFEIKVSMFNVE